MESDIRRMLEMLDRTFTVRHIMIPAEELQRAETFDGALSVLSAPDCRYDVIPYPNEGQIKGYASKNVSKAQGISPSILISDGTTILDLLDILSPDQSFRFVLSGDRIRGFVNFSDFNNPLVKLPFFALLERVEFAIWTAIEPKLEERVLREALDRADCSRIEKRLGSERKNDVDIGYRGALYLSDMLKVAGHLGYITIDGQHRQAIEDTRNRVFHADKPMIDDRRHLRTLQRSRDGCNKIMEDLELVRT